MREPPEKIHGPLSLGSALGPLVRANQKFEGEGMTTGLVRKEFFTIPELAQRWSVSCRTARRRLIALRTKVLDFNPRGGRCRKLVPFGAILELENRQLRAL